MRDGIIISMLLVALAGTAIAVAPVGAAPKDDRCRPVNGHLEEMAGPGPGFTAEGRLTGGIQGTDRFTLLSSSPSHETTPTVINFVGESVFETKTGDIELAVSGAFDTESGRFSDLLTIIGGTGEWQGASGQLHLFGVFNPETGTGESDYRGEICTG